MTATMDVQRNTSDAFVQLLSQWECILRGVVALGMQRAMRMPHICHLWPFRLYCIYFTLSHEQQDFRKKKFIAHKMYFDFLYNFV